MAQDRATPGYTRTHQRIVDSRAQRAVEVSAFVCQYQTIYYCHEHGLPTDGQAAPLKSRLPEATCL
jgi:hypothetical protein